MTTIRDRTIEVDGMDVFVRQADDPARPSIVLLSGYPSSTRACIRLIDRLAGIDLVRTPQREKLLLEPVGSFS